MEIQEVRAAAQNLNVYEVALKIVRGHSLLNHNSYTFESLDKETRSKKILIDTAGRYAVGTQDNIYSFCYKEFPFRRAVTVLHEPLGGRFVIPSGSKNVDGICVDVDLVEGIALVHMLTKPYLGFVECKSNKIRSQGILEFDANGLAIAGKSVKEGVCINMRAQSDAMTFNILDFIDDPKIKDFFKNTPKEELEFYIVKVLITGQRDKATKIT